MAGFPLFGDQRAGFLNGASLEYFQFQSTRKCHLAPAVAVPGDSIARLQRKARCLEVRRVHSEDWPRAIEGGLGQEGK
jgi:hypothetical protein